jgi:hypothetical protein
MKAEKTLPGRIIFVFTYVFIYYKCITYSKIIKQKMQGLRKIIRFFFHS